MFVRRDAALRDPFANPFATASNDARRRPARQCRLERARRKPTRNYAAAAHPSPVAVVRLPPPAPATTGAIAKATPTQPITGFGNGWRAAGGSPIVVADGDNARSRFRAATAFRLRRCCRPMASRAARRCMAASTDRAGLRRRRQNRFRRAGGRASAQGAANDQAAEAARKSKLAKARRRAKPPRTSCQTSATRSPPRTRGERQGQAARRQAGRGSSPHEKPSRRRRRQAGARQAERRRQAVKPDDVAKAEIAAARRRSQEEAGRRHRADRQRPCRRPGARRR